MLKCKCELTKTLSWWIIGVVILALAAACAPESTPTEQPSRPLFQKMPADQETSGFLGDYSNLEPDPDLEGDTLGYVNEEAYEGLDDYIAIIVDPVEIYMATDVDESLIPTDGIEAVNHLNDTKPDLILLDIILPRMDGYKVLSIVRENPDLRNVPVIMLTSRDGLLNKVRGKMAGSTAYLTKPFEPKKLLETIQKYLN